MYICMDCYQDRGEKILLTEHTHNVCDFCQEFGTTYTIQIHELQHWTDVARYQGWRERD